MGYGIISALIAIAAAFLLWMSFRLLSNRRWIVGFARGLSGFFLLFLSVSLLFSAQDIFSYRTLLSEQTLMTMSFHRTSPKHFTVELQEATGASRKEEIDGDQWQLNVRMFYWTPLFKAVGFRTGYQLDSIKGRYIELDMKNSGTVPVALRTQDHKVDVWNFVNENSGAIPGLEAVIVTPGFMPLVDGAIFEVVLSGTELIAKPLNDAAKTTEFTQ
jgi:hypothetical protein